MSDKLREAAQAALSAMDYMLRNGEWYCAEERANALRAALAEPAIKESLTVAEPEPVAWYHNCFGTLELSRVQRLGWSPLYSAPQRREWVGLTDQETKLLWTEHGYRSAMCKPFAQAIEAKLREKNT